MFSSNSIQVFFMSRALMNEVIGRLNIKQYSIGKAYYAPGKTGTYCVFDGFATVDDLICKLRDGDYVTKLLNRNPTAYDTRPITIFFRENSNRITISLIFTN